MGIRFASYVEQIFPFGHLQKEAPSLPFPRGKGAGGIGFPNHHIEKRAKDRNLHKPDTSINRPSPRKGLDGGVCKFGLLLFFGQRTLRTKNMTGSAKRVLAWFLQRERILPNGGMLASSYISAIADS